MSKAGFPFVSMRWMISVVLLLAAGSARAEEFYYVIVFGSQRESSNPRYTHSWGIFVKATGEGPCLESYAVEAHTISWMPQSLIIRLRALCAEPGVNLDPHTSIRWALDTDQRISAWGPYQIERELYCMALQQKALLESGQVRYKAIDSGRRTDRVSNCIHALTSTVGGYRTRVISPSWGQTASYLISRRFEPWYVNPDQTYRCLMTRLCLDQYPIIYRGYDRNPRNGVYWGFLKRTLNISDPDIPQ